MAAKRTLLRLQPLLAAQHSLAVRSFATTSTGHQKTYKFNPESTSSSKPASHREDASASAVARHAADSSSIEETTSSFKFDEELAPLAMARRPPSSTPNQRPSFEPRPELSQDPSTSTDASMARTVFVRTKDGKHLVSVVHTLSLLAQLASKFGPIQRFHFPREPSSQRLLGYGSVTFSDKESVRKALANEGIHSIVLPPIVPSRAPRTYLSDKDHARFVGMDPLISCAAPAENIPATSVFLSARSLQNPASVRPGWNDVAPLCNMEAKTKTSYFVDETQADDLTPEEAIIRHDSKFYLSTSPVSVEIKMERRTTAFTARPGRSESRSTKLHRNVRSALQQFGGFSNVIQEQGLLPDTIFTHASEGGARTGGASKRSKPRGRTSNLNSSRQAPSGRRSFSTSAISRSTETVKAKRKAEWQRNRHSNFVDQLFLRVTGGKGGDGCVSFHREKFVQFGPPSGGNGGSGGSIYIRAVDGPTTLARISRRFRGADGPHGQGSFLHGKKAEDKFIEVPVGTVVTATRRLHIPEEEEAEEYYLDLLKRAAKAKWDPTGMVAKEDAVLAAEQQERRRVARSQPAPEIEHGASENDADTNEVEASAKENNPEEEELDGEDLLEPEVARQLQSLRERVWRHYPRAEETNYRRNEFRAAEMRLALDRRRRRRYLAQSQAAQSAASVLTFASSTSAGDQPSAASVTPYEDQEPLDEPWRIDLDEPTPAGSAGILLASGGRGGLGNPTFLSSSNRSPKFATRGEYGEALEVMLELKRPSDIGLVGLPNAGKSTILRSISASKAQVGHWRFTTLSPNLGVVRLASDGGVLGVDDSEVLEGYGEDGVESRTAPLGEEEFRLTLSDIPGLIDGAAENKGLGHTFLRHIERCCILAYVLDLTEPEPWRDLKILDNELGSYRQDLPQKVRLVIVNKADQFATREEIEAAKAKIERINKTVDEIAEDRLAVSGDACAGRMKLMVLSAKKKQGTQVLAKTLVDLLKEQRESEGAKVDEKWAGS